MTTNRAPACAARSTCSARMTVPAPTSRSLSAASIRSADSADSVRRVSSTNGSSASLSARASAGLVRLDPRHDREHAAAAHGAISALAFTARASRRRRGAPCRRHSRSRGGEEHRCACEISRLAPATCRNPLQDGAAAQRVGVQCLRVVGRDVPGCDRVDVDAHRRPFVGERADDTDDRRLGGRIARNANPALEAQHRGGEDQLASSSFEHLAADQLAEEKRRGQVDLENPVPAIGSVRPPAPVRSSRRC